MGGEGEGAVYVFVCLYECVYRGWGVMYVFACICVVRVGIVFVYSSIYFFIIFFCFFSDLLLIFSPVLVFLSLYFVLHLKKIKMQVSLPTEL